MNSEDRICPLSQKICDEKCAWAVHSYLVDEDGISHQQNCAIHIIAQYSMSDLEAAV